MKRRWSFVIRHSSFVILLTLLLSACGFSTDTIATVGGEKITRGELAANGATTPANQAALLEQLIYLRLLDLEARSQKITVTEAEIAAQNKSDIDQSQSTDAFVQALQQDYPSAASYYQSVRLQLLVQKTRPLWFTGNVSALSFQQLTTDTQQKAQEVAQKGRAGTSFDELLKTYALPDAQAPERVNVPGSISAGSLPGSIRSAFPELKEGAYSEPLPSNGQFVVLRISKIEQRPPTDQEGQELLVGWLDKLKTKYQVSITDPALSTASGQ